MARYRRVDFQDRNLVQVFRVSPYQVLEFGLILRGAGFSHEPTERGDLAKSVGVANRVHALGEMLQLRPVAPR